MTAQDDAKLQNIYSLGKVQAAKNPRVTALAYYLQELENEILGEMAKEASALGGAKHVEPHGLGVLPKFVWADHTGGDSSRALHRTRFECASRVRAITV